MAEQQDHLRRESDTEADFLDRNEAPIKNLPASESGKGARLGLSQLTIDNDIMQRKRDKKKKIENLMSQSNDNNKGGNSSSSENSVKVRNLYEQLFKGHCTDMLRNNFIFVFFVYHSTIRQNIWMAGWIQT